MQYKKPVRWVVLGAVVLCIVGAVCLLTDRVQEPSDRYLLAEAWPLAQSCAQENHVAIEKSNNEILRSEDGTQIKVTYPLVNADTRIVVRFAMEGQTIASVSADLEKPALSLHAVRLLAQKGEALTWSDFEDYAYIETGSGLYIRLYEMDETYSLWIGGSSTAVPPIYIYLSRSADLSDRIDIRTDNVDAFLRAHSGSTAAGGGETSDTETGDPLDAAVSAAILEENIGEETKGLFACESHVTLATESGGSNLEETVVVYAIVLYQEYRFSSGAFYEVAGSHIPAALTFAVGENGAYALTEYWTPGDGSEYEPDLREKFPVDVVADALDTQKYILSQIQHCYAQAVEYGQIDTAPVIQQLFETIVADPTPSSNPRDFIARQPTAYHELTYFGDYTLRYCFREFLKGGQTDLRGQIMSAVVQDLIGDEGDTVEGNTGQAYFDAWRANVEQVSQQKGESYLREHGPKGWLLMQMLRGETE